MSFRVGDDELLSILERVMNVSARRQTVVASNLANIDTPGYRTVDMDFDAALRQAVRGRRTAGVATTHRAHLGGGPSAGTAPVRPVDGLTVRNDENNVDLDREMLALSQSRGRFETAADILRHRLHMLLMAVTDGRSNR